MANPELTDRYEQAAQQMQTAVGDILVEVERLKDINKYLSEKLTDSHQFHGALIRERDGYQVKYEVLREVSLKLVSAWDNAKVTMMDDLNAGVIRVKEVLGLTTETQPFEALENRTHDYQTGWAEDGPVPDGETNF